jgi:hypothetical protein
MFSVKHKQNSLKRARLKFIIYLTTGVVLNGCAPVLIPMDKDALARLSDHPQVLAVHYLRPSPTPRSKSSHWLPTGTSPIGNAIGVGILLLQLAADNAGPPSDYCWDDPVTKVKERFVSSLNRRLELKNVRLVETPLADDDPEALRGSLESSVVIDFKTLACSLGSGEVQLGNYSGRARLLHLQDSKIAWQGECKVQTAREATSGLEHPRTRTNASPETADSDEFVDRCAEDLIAQFTQ